jgi:hypothetical protein
MGLPIITGLQHVDAADPWWRVRIGGQFGRWCYWHAWEGWVRPMASYREPVA